MPGIFNSLLNATKSKYRSLKNRTRRSQKKVRMNSPKNIVKEYSLDSEEKKYKSSKIPSNITTKCGSGRFPCKYRNTVFQNGQEWKDYLNIINNRNTKNTGLSRQTVMSELSKKGKSAKKIPPEYRLYNIQTGEIFDLRDFSPSKI